MRAKKVDANQAEIVEEYRKLGFSVYSCAPMGKGFPDLVVGYMGYSDLVECKDGSLPPSKRKLTPDQVKFFDSWRGSVRVVMNLEGVRAHRDDIRERAYGQKKV